MKMTKFRKILLSILIPLFIITVIFFYVYNSPENQIKRKIEAVITAQESLKADLDIITVQDYERFNFEMTQLDKLMDKEDFSLEGVDIKGISKNDEKLAGELELFEDKIGQCKDQLEALDLEPEKYTEKYYGLLQKLNRSLDILSYFSANYRQALSMDKVIMDDFEKFALSEGQDMILKPLERYYKQAKAFKNMFVTSLNSSITEFNALNGKKAEIVETKPQEKDIKTIMDNLASKNYKILGRITEDLDGDPADELVVLSATPDGTIVEIYDFKNNAYEKIWENNIGKTPAKNLFARYYSLMPEVVVLPGGASFKYNGKEYKMTL